MESAGEVSHDAARGAAIRSIAEVAGKVATLAWTVAAARILSATDFGVVSYALAVMLLVSALPAWGFDAGLVRGGAAEPETLERRYTSAQSWKTLLAIPTLAVTALVVLPRQHDAASRWVVVLTLAAALPELWSQTVRSASSARRQPGAVSTALVAQRLCTGLLIVGVLLAGLGMVAVASAFLIGTLMGWAVHVVALRRIGVRPARGLPTRANLERAARGTWLIGLNGLMLMLLFRVDALILEGMKGVEAVALYALAYRLLETVLFVTYAVNQAVFPVLSASRDKVRWRRGYERSLSAGAFVYLPFMVVCMVDGAQLTGLLYGELYSTDVAEILLWLAPAPLFFAAAFFASILLMAMEAPRPMLVATMIGSVVNLGLNVVLIPTWSGVGAAAATTIAYTVQAIGMQVAIRRLEIAPRLVRPLLPAVMAAGALAVALFLLPWPFLFELTVGAVVYLGTWLLLVSWLDPMQRVVLLGLARRR